MREANDVDARRIEKGLDLKSQDFAIAAAQRQNRRDGDLRLEAAMYERIGFSVSDACHVIPGYYPDDASRNYAALVVRNLGT